RTSLWALAAMVTALVGGLTPFGGILAMLVGLVAVLIIFRRRKQLTGQWIALTAIGLGLFGTVLTGVLLFRPQAAPVGEWLRDRPLAGQYDDSGGLEVSDKRNEVTLKRTSRDWGVMKRGYTYDPSISDLQVEQADDQQQGVQKPRASLLLFNRKRNAYVDVIRDDRNANLGTQEYQSVLEAQLNPYQKRFLGGDEGGFFGRDRTEPGGGHPDRGENLPNFDVSARKLEEEEILPHLFNEQEIKEILKRKEEGKKPTVEGREWPSITVKRGGQTWRFVIRAYRKGTKGSGMPISLIRAYTPTSRST